MNNWIRLQFVALQPFRPYGATAATATTTKIKQLAAAVVVVVIVAPRYSLFCAERGR